MLSVDSFREVVKSTPLISVDLVVKDSIGRILLGKRVNPPAQGFWFVPGGRIFKGEEVNHAFSRILGSELDVSSSEIKTAFLGVYQHFYDDNFAGTGFSTHYVVLCYEVHLECLLNKLPLDQHSEYRWFTKLELLNDMEVHSHSKWYFQENKQADNIILS
ncbi:GDP-mannose mannosyl hydrolase [Maricurvus nonylphenolicus]